MASQNEMDKALDETIKSVIYLINQAFSNTTKIYDGIVLANNNDGKWNIRYNGEVHAVKPYGSVSPVVNSVVKVIIPQGNQALAFFI